LNNIGVTLQAKGNLPDAEASLRRALAIAEKAYGPVHPEVETALVNLGDLLSAERRLDAAVAVYRRAAAISEKVVGPEHPHTAEDLGGLGIALLEEKRAAEALPVLERAVAIGERAQAEPVSLAKSRFALARALWQSGGDRARAVALARAAQKILETSGERQAPDVEQINRWLAHARAPHSE
jgi:tetratricopeptide (TPR) repeat protein